jgi:hypothetical protein
MAMPVTTPTEVAVLLLALDEALVEAELPVPLENERVPLEAEPPLPLPLPPPPLVAEGLGVGCGLRLPVTVNGMALTAVPAGVVTTIRPLKAPAGTVAVICVSLSALKTLAGRPSKPTAVTPLKPVPVRVTVAPTGPEAGEKLVSVGVVAEGEGDGVLSAGAALVTTRAAVVTMRVVVACVPVLELLEALPVPLSEIVMASRALASVKSALTVSAMVAVAAVEVR